MKPQNSYSDEKDDTKNKYNGEKDGTSPTGKEDTISTRKDDTKK